MPSSRASRSASRRWTRHSSIRWRRGSLRTRSGRCTRRRSMAAHRLHAGIGGQQGARPAARRPCCAGDRDPCHRPTMLPMSGLGPTGDDNPFEGMPFFGDLGQDWHAAPPGAIAVGRRPSDGHADGLRGRVRGQRRPDRPGWTSSSWPGWPSSTSPGRPVSPRRSPGGACRSCPSPACSGCSARLDAYRPLFESLASRSLVGRSAGTRTDPIRPSRRRSHRRRARPADGLDGADDAGGDRRLDGRAPRPAQLRPVRPAGPPRRPPTSCCWSCPTSTSSPRTGASDRNELRLWLCLHEIAHHAVLGVPHVRAALEGCLREYAAGFRPDAGALERQARLESTCPTPSRRWPSCRTCSAIPRSCSARSRPTPSGRCSPASRRSSP